MEEKKVEELDRCVARLTAWCVLCGMHAAQPLLFEGVRNLYRLGADHRHGTPVSVRQASPHHRSQRAEYDRDRRASWHARRGYHVEFIRKTSGAPAMRGSFAETCW